MRGRAVAISLSRRVVIDFMRFAHDVPAITIMRRMRLARLVTARAQWAKRPMWTTLFVKAYGMLSGEIPELRRAYVKLPWPHFYEYPQSVASIPMRRNYFGEEALFPFQIKDPATMSLSDLDDQLVRAKTAPIDEVKDFRRLLRIARLPGPLRRALYWFGLNVGRQRANYFGTFLISTVARHGGELQNVLSPVGNNLSYGVISPEGDVDVRIICDHRVVDALPLAHALVRLEQILAGPIADELIALQNQSQPPSGAAGM